MDARLQVLLEAALVPLAVGVIWYNPYLLGRLWGSGIGIAKEKMTAGKVALISVVSIVAGYYIAGSLSSIVIHQHGVYGMLAGDPDMKDKSSALYNIVQGLMDKYGNNYRTFKHGAFHGMFTGLKIALPILAILGFAESKKISWILIHAIYWTICLSIMGGIVCAYMP